jgi:hypothetical protein
MKLFLFFLANKFELRSFFIWKMVELISIWIIAQPTALVLVAYFGTEDDL